MTVDVQYVVDQIRDFEALSQGGSRRQRPPRYTVEIGRGETYRSIHWTIYGHKPYPRHSVLAGQMSRCYICDCGAGEEGLELARQAIDLAKVGRRTDFFDSGATSHVPVDVVTRHLPDGEDY
jgi:hypothetical protein